MFVSAIFFPFSINFTYNHCTSIFLGKCTYVSNLTVLSLTLSLQDERFDHLVASFKPKSVVPAVLTVTDIAGLVKGAAEGAGLGNAFLSNIAAVDGIFHMCRGFGGEEVTHVEGSVDPVRDLDIIHNELRLKDLAVASSKVEGSRKNVERKVGGKEAKEEFDVLEKVVALLTSGKDVRAGEWTSAEIEVLNRQQFLTAKPMVYLVNLSEKDYVRKRNKFLEPLAKWLEARGYGDKMIPVSCEFEQKIVDMTPEAREAYCKENQAKSAMPRIIRTGYHVLNLVHFFTAGPDEVRAWTIKQNTLAPGAAGTIHSDFQAKFIAAEIYNFDDFKECGSSEAAVKAAGKSRTQGKLYEVQDGDVCFFKHNA